MQMAHLAPDVGLAVALAGDKVGADDMQRLLFRQQAAHQLLESHGSLVRCPTPNTGDAGQKETGLFRGRL